MISKFNIFENLFIVFRNGNFWHPFDLLEEASVSLRELQTFLKIYNRVFSKLLWQIKLSCLLITIISQFAAIRLIHSNPLLALFYTSIDFGAVVTYFGIFQFAHKVTEKVEDLLELMEIQSALLVNSVEKKYWKRVLRSIPRMGIEIGGFGPVEREAIPIFVNFSVQQIVSLLITFK